MSGSWSRLPAALRAVLLGVLSALALPPLYLVPVLLLAVPALLRMIGAARDWKRAALLGFLYGMGLHTAGLYWITDAILVRAAEYWWAVPLASPLTAVPLSLLVGLVCALCRLAPAGWRRIALFASLWTLSDLLRQFLFSGFPWNLWGSVWEFPGLAGTVMIQPAAWISVHGLTLLTVLLAASPLLGRRGLLAGAAVLLVWVAAGSARLASLSLRGAPSGAPGPIVVLVQGDIPEQDKQDGNRARAIFRTYLALTRSGVAEADRLRARDDPSRPILFAWPESAFPALLEQEPEARRLIMQAAPGAVAGLIGSVRFGRDGRPRNSLIAVLPDGSIGPEYDKAHLVPFGEYQPAHLPVQIVPGGGFEPGPGVRTLHVPGLPPIGPLICYEVIFPGQVVRESDRPAWLLNVTNDAWFGDSAGPRQHLDTARMRAVEEGLPLARVANTGISAVFDADGRERARLGWGIAGTLVVPIRAALPPTLFARFGLVVPLVLAALVGGLSFAGSLVWRRRHVSTS
jgi:apolipoprotein N-acyltransferase